MLLSVVVIVVRVASRENYRVSNDLILYIDFHRVFVLYFYDSCLMYSSASRLILNIC